MGVANGNENPGRRFPIFFRVWQQVPGVLVGRDGIAVFAFFGEGVANFTETADAGVQVRVKFGVGHVVPLQFDGFDGIFLAGHIASQ